jgi:hypothetical protein
MFKSVTFLLLFITSISLNAQDGIYKSPLVYNFEYRDLIAENTKIFVSENEGAFIGEETEDDWRNWKTVENFEFGKDRGDMMMIADLNALHPFFRDKVSALIKSCNSKGIELAIVETYRTPLKQNEYKSMGKKYTRTPAGRSKHQYGLAVDIVPVVNGEAQWNNIRLWRKIGVIGESLGLRWGGRWKSLYDPGHFEWSGGLTSQQLALGFLPKVPNQHLYPCLEEDLIKLVEKWQAIEIEQSLTVRNETHSTRMN